MTTTETTEPTERQKAASNVYLREAIQRVLDHYFDAERDDFVATSGYRGPGHIYESLLYLTNWMESTEVLAPK
jgi:hypothetical protein